MDGTVFIAALGILSTAGTAWYTTRSQRQGERDGRLLEARVRVYGECATSLYEYERATYNRVKARLNAVPDRDDLRQEAYRVSAQARAAIGQVAIMCDDNVHKALEEWRQAVSKYKTATTDEDLREQRTVMLDGLDRALRLARKDIAP